MVWKHANSQVTYKILMKIFKTHPNSPSGLYDRLLHMYTIHDNQ